MSKVIIIHIQIHDYKYKMKYNNNRYDFTDLIKLYSAAAFINGDRYSAAKGPGSLKGLVKLWTICRVLVLPGLQMDSKADHDPHAN